MVRLFAAVRFSVPSCAALATAALLAACGGSDDASAGADTSTAASDTGTAGTTAAPTTGADTADSGDTTSGADSTGASGTDFDAPGPHPVGNVRIVIQDADGGRELPVEIWYPADASAAADAEAGVPLADFSPDEPEHTQLADLVAAAPPECTRAQTRSAPDALPADVGPYPLIVFSHCHECTRYSTLTVVERLVSHGFAVAAPDHVGNTLFDGIAGTGVDIGGEFLTVRAADIGRVLDVVLDADATEVPESLRGRFDADTVGMFGHSFGSVTVGRVLQDDDRVQAGVAIAAPVENPLIPGVSIDAIDEPLLLMLAQEDNSIMEVGNNLLRANFEAAAPPVWLVEFQDTGHWSFTDICDIVDGFQPGCGDGIRQTRPGAEFTYLDNDLVRETTARYTTRFFAAHLLGDADADAALDEAAPADVVTVSVRRE